MGRQARPPSSCWRHLDAPFDRFAKEEPKIDAAIKNFMSVLLAEGLTTPDSSGHDPPATFQGPTEHAGNENAPSSIGRPAWSTRSTVQTAQVLGRTLSRCINSFQLPPSHIWGQIHPQGAEQTASDRIDEVSRYKVAFHLWQKSVETGAKPTRLFGAHFLLVSR
jgi:hypothetical protein